MAQLPGSPRINEYIASAGQTVFTYTYRIQSDAEIKVTKAGVLLTLTTDYTVQDAGEPTGGTITLVVPASDGNIMILTGNTLIQRITEFQNNGDFLASAINGEYNVLDDITSELLTTGGAGFHLDTPSLLIDTGVPTPEARKTMIWNSAANKLEMSVYDPDEQVALAEAAAAAADASAIAAAGYASDASDSKDAAAISESAAAVSAAEAAASAASINLPALGSDIIPATTDIYDLGSGTKKFADVHAVSGSFTDGYITNDLDVTNDAGVGNNLTVTGEITTGGNKVTTNRMMIVNDVKAYNVDGGTFTSGAWRTRTLNNVQLNEIPGASLASDQITLPAGEYLFYAEVPSVETLYTAAILYNITDAAWMTPHSTTYSSYLTNALCLINMKFTLTTESVFEIMNYCSNTRATDGFGHQSGISGVNSIFTRAFITKIGE